MAKRRLVPVREDLVEELSRIARRSGMTLVEFVEAVLGHAVRVLRGRDDVASVLGDAVVYADIARFGGVPVPLDALASLLGDGAGDGARLLAERSAALARLVALSARARGVEAGRAAGMVIRSFFPGAAVDLVEDEEDGRLRVIVASPALASSEGLAGLVEAVVRSVVEALGFRVESSRREPGLVVVEASGGGGGGGG